MRHIERSVLKVTPVNVDLFQGHQNESYLITNNASAKRIYNAYVEWLEEKFVTDPAGWT